MADDPLASGGASETLALNVSVPVPSAFESRPPTLPVQGPPGGPDRKSGAVLVQVPSGPSARAGVGPTARAAIIPPNASHLSTRSPSVNQVIQRWRTKVESSLDARPSSGGG